MSYRHRIALRLAVLASGVLAVGLARSVTGSRAPQAGPGPTVLDSVVELHDSVLAVPDVDPISRRLGLTARRVVAGDVTLHVIDTGRATPVVLVNGGPGNTLQSFLPSFLRATEFARVIFYDQRGTGLSEWKRPPGGYSTAQAVADLEALRRALGIDRWVVLGHSYGGLIAQWYALRHPEATAGLVLVASSVPMQGLELGEREYRTPEERRRIRAAYTISGNFVVPTHSDRADLETVRSLVFNGYVNGDWKRQYFHRPSRERMAHIARHEWLHDRNLNAEVRADGFARNLTGAFDGRIPTLIIEGKWDPNWGEAKPELFAGQHPGARLAVLPRSSHFPFDEEPERFFATLEAFVRTR